MGTELAIVFAHIWGLLIGWSLHWYYMKLRGQKRLEEQLQVQLKHRVETMLRIQGFEHSGQEDDHWREVDWTAH